MVEHLSKEDTAVRWIDIASGEVREMSGPSHFGWVYNLNNKFIKAHQKNRISQPDSWLVIEFLTKISTISPETVESRELRL
jgi:hypothetical protein